MKYRTSFVSNSSSSSFTIPLDKITARQLKLIQTHQIKGEKYGVSDGDTDPWDIEVTEHYVKGSTGMDNFDMSFYLNAIGIPDDVIQWGD